MQNTDMLLFNITNFGKTKVFPYAFVQVSEVARRYQLRVMPFDVTDYPKDKLSFLVRHLIKKYQPKMIGLTLRNIDSLFSTDYPMSIEMMDYFNERYLPIIKAKEFITLIRTVSEIPIVVGGCGFSLFPNQAFVYLNPDYGVQGESNSFFANFQNILDRKELHAIPNLVYSNGNDIQVNQRVYHDPSPFPEYNEEIVEHIIKFYGFEAAYKNNMPVEIMRGCPHRCSYCCEPGVYGNNVRLRDIDVVMRDIEFLYEHGFTIYWLVCSEINTAGNDLFLFIAEKICKFNEQRQDNPIVWTSYFLPTGLSKSEWAIIFRSNFYPSWFEFASLDDENLAALQVPYRAAQVINDIKIHKLFARSPLFARDSRLRKYLADTSVTIFLGNKFITKEVIKTTIKKYDELELGNFYKNAVINPATRIFDIHHEMTEYIYSIDTKVMEELNFLCPTFYYARELVDHFGDVKKIYDFFHYLESTIFSTAFRKSIDWTAFIAEATSPAMVIALIEKIPQMNEHEIKEIILDIFKVKHISDEGMKFITHNLQTIMQNPAMQVQQLFSPPSYIEKSFLNLSIMTLLLHIILQHWEKCQPIIDYLHLNRDRRALFNGSIYQMMAPLYGRYSSNIGLLADVATTLKIEQQAAGDLFLRFFLKYNNVNIREEYRELLYD